MDDILRTLQGLNQDQHLVALFACLLVMCAGTAVVVAILRSLGRWGRVALFVALAAVVIAYRGWLR